MTIFVAGATGALGLPLVRQLCMFCHQVVGMARVGRWRATSPRKMIEQFPRRRSELIIPVDAERQVANRPWACDSDDTLMDMADERRGKRGYRAKARLAIGFIDYQPGTIFGSDLPAIVFDRAVRLAPKA